MADMNEMRSYEEIAQRIENAAKKLSGSYKNLGISFEQTQQAALSNLEKQAKWAEDQIKNFQGLTTDLASRSIDEQINAQKKVQEAAKDALYKKEKKQIDDLQKLREKYEKATDEEEKKNLKNRIAQEDKALNDKYKKEIDHQKIVADNQKKLDEARSKRIKIQLNDASSALSSITSAISEGKSLNTITAGIASSLESQIESIASKKGKIDTRLQGWTMSGTSSDSNLRRLKNGGSYWDQISNEITGTSGLNAYFKQDTYVNNIESMVRQGIAANIEQRALLATLSEKIATTFEATNSTLLRLVRIQEQDTTAARLGMESSLTAFLNNMYETTEYMESISKTVKTNLEESMALMTGSAAVGYEYQVQKWLGSMYSTGMDQGSVTSIASALGGLSAGKISSISNGGAGNLLIMAANRSNLSISDILSGGLTEATSNKLLQSVVDYLAEIYNETKDSRVVQQQIAEVYGVTASDLKAAASLSRSSSIVSRSSSNYSQSLARLAYMASTISSRTSLGEMGSNTWSNLMYTLSSGIANNPALYGIYKVGTTMNSLGAGMDLPDIKYLGTGINLQTSIANLLESTALAGSLLSGIGQMAIGAGGGAGLNNGVLNMLKNTGAFSYNTLSRGASGDIINSSGLTTSSSGMIGNTSSSDIESATLQSAYDESVTTLEEQKDSSEDITIADVNNSVVLIYQLLQRFEEGTAKITVNYDGISSLTGSPI